jgi:hypothetical protein
MQIGGNPERLAAVSQGAIQATLLEQAFAYQARKGGFRSLLDYATIGLDYQHAGIGTTKSFVERNRELITRFMKALIEGTHRFKTDTAFGKKVIERHLRITDTDTINSAYEYYSSHTDFVPYVNLKGVKFILDGIGENNPKEKSLKPEDIGDNSILKEIEASGFVKQITGGR